MGKPLGYWNLDYRNQLISDISEHFGDGLERMTYLDSFWLVQALTQHLYDEYGFDEIESQAAREVFQRVGELSTDEIQCLIRAIVNS